MSDMTSQVVKQIVNATLDRLNASGLTVASVYDAMLALRRVQEEKVRSAFHGLFSDKTLSELATIHTALEDMLPKPVITASITKPPAESNAAVTPPIKGSKIKKR